MRLVADDMIDFAKYLEAPAEAARIVNAYDLYDRVMERFRSDGIGRGARLPWSVSHDRVRIRPAELSIWAGINGHGKSMLLGQVMLEMARQDESCLIVSLELSPTETMCRIVTQATGGEKNDFPVGQFLTWADARIWLYDQCGIMAPERAVALCRYAVKELRVKHVVIDSLMKLGVYGKDNDGQARTLNELQTLAKDTGLHIHLVHHMRKGQSENDVPGKFDVRGAGEITDMADNLFVIWANKAKQDMRARGDYIDDSEPDAILAVHKQRHGAWEGKLRLWFDPRSLTYHERGMRASR